MALTQIDGGHFSAIAASSNPTLKRDSAKARSRLNYVKETLNKYSARGEPVEP